MRLFTNIAAIGISVLCLSLTAIPAANTKVYICKSSTAYAWHTHRDCYGLGKCTHDIEKVTESEAKDLGYTKLCGYCAKR
jgi:hypothetical protein